MKFIAIVLLGASAHVSAGGHSQITLSETNTPLQKVFQKIQQQSGYDFVSTYEIVKEAGNVTVNLQNVSLQKALEECLKGKPLAYVITGRTVMIQLKEKDYYNSSNNRDVLESLLSLPIEIHGRVANQNGEPLQNASVVISGTKIGTTTNIDGRFILTAPDDKNIVLEISSVGFQTKTVNVGKQTEINVVLETAVTGLSDVVVVGYGTQKKRDLTGSISSVKGSDVNQQAIINPVQALTGLAAGTQTLQNSGAPGNTLSVIIRGDNSLLGGNEPLYVVDGFPYAGSLNNLNPNNIQSIEVLKDASATAIYGSRGSNGVVIITTKKGKAGRTSVEFNGYYGWQKVSKELNLLNAKEFATLANVRAANDGIAPYFTQNQIDSFGVGTNWQDEIFHVAPIQNYSLGVSGGNDKSTFLLAGNYINQEGIIINSKYHQAQLKTDYSAKIYKSWKIDFNGIFSRTFNSQLHSDNSERGFGVLSGALVASPTLSVKNKDGSFSNVRAYPFTPDISENPVAMTSENKQSRVNNALLSNLVLNGNITPYIVFHTSIGLQYNITRGDNYSPSIFQQSATGTASISYSEQSHLVNENLLTYTKDFGMDNHLVVLGGLTSEQTITQGDVAGSKGFPNDILQNNSLQSGTVPSIPTSSYSKYNLLSWLGRVEYSYKDKYLLTASTRADGSSVFGMSNKWGYFPSFSAGWRVSEEKFWSGLRNAIGGFKLRGSWGQAGNTAVSPYQSLSILSSMSTVFGSNLYVGFAPGSTKPNPNLKWETTSQLDLGADLLFWAGRVALTFDYYHKVTSDLLAAIPLPTSSGYRTQPANIGSVRNNGFELDLNTHLINHSKFRWDLGGTFSVNRNKVLSLAGDADIFGGDMDNTLPAMSLVRVGQPIGVFYGYVEDGISPNGSIKYKDLNGDSTINSLDRTIIGNPHPKYIFGINSNLSYGGFGLSIIINGSQGNNVLAYDLSSIANGFYFGENQLNDVLGNYWTQDHPNPNAKYPKVSSATRYLGSDRYIKNGSYVRLQNIQLSYTLKSKDIKAIGVTSAQVYLSGQNLITLTNYPLYSPDNNTKGAGIARGIDMMGYPNARTILVGLRINL